MKRERQRILANACKKTMFDSKLGEFVHTPYSALA
jgi:hypothetical protein